MKKELSSKHIKEQFLLLLVADASFLLFAVFIGDLKWFTDFRDFVLLISGIFAIFSGIISMLRYSAQKDSIQYFILGIGLVGVGILDIISLLMTLENFEALFSSGDSIYSFRMIFSKCFLSFLLFFSCFLEVDNIRMKKKSFRILGFFIFIILTASFLIYSKILGGFTEEYMTISFSVLSLILLVVAGMGYLCKKNWKYENIDFWIIFSISFFILSQIFYIPFLNLETEYAVDLSVLAQFFGYVSMLFGFLASIRDLYVREIEEQKELEFTKKKVEEAYLTLRKEKMSFVDEQKKRGKKEKKENGRDK